VGYSAYYTTAIWFGFDKPGNSLGVNLTGSTLAGPVWADFMREIHQGLPYKDFVKPSTGIIDVTVCAKSGLLKTPACNQGDVTMPFLEGTQPTQYCNIHGGGTTAGLYTETMRSDVLGFDDNDLLKGLTMPTLPAEFMESLPAPANTSSSRRNTSSSSSGSSRSSNRSTSRNSSAGSSSSRTNSYNSGNPLLDPEDEEPPVTIDSFFPVDEEDLAPALPDTSAEHTEYGLELPVYNPLLD
jgi:penicillin-binding protein 1A